MERLKYFESIVDSVYTGVMGMVVLLLMSSVMLMLQIKAILLKDSNEFGSKSIVLW